MHHENASEMFCGNAMSPYFPAGWLRLQCAELGTRYKMPSRSAIAKMGGDNDREDKDRIMAGFLSGSDHVLAYVLTTLFSKH